MSKVEKYNKPNLLVAEKVVALVEKEITPSANFSSGDRDKKFDRNREHERKRCFSCGSDKHLLRECPSRQDYHYDRRQGADQQYAEAAYRKPENRPESPKLKSILRRKSGDNGSSKAKHAKHFVSADNEEWHSE
jgi:hypothetical protein